LPQRALEDGIDAVGKDRREARLLLVEGSGEQFPGVLREAA
jgi:hypothetical protein